MVNVTALFAFFIFVVGATAEEVVSRGFLVENNSSRPLPLPCVIFLFKRNENSKWSLFYRYEYFEATNSMTNLSPGYVYQLAVSCPNDIQAIPERHQFAVHQQKYDKLVIVTLTFVDRVIEIQPTCEVNKTRASISNLPPTKNETITQKDEQKEEWIEEKEDRREESEDNGAQAAEHIEETQRSGITEQEEVVRQSSWEAMKIYARYLLFLILILQVVWVLRSMKGDSNSKRTVINMCEFRPPSEVINHLSK